MTTSADIRIQDNHDPTTPRREFEAAHPGDFTWDCLESGPERWRVGNGRAADRG